MAWPNSQTRRVELVVQNAQVAGSGTHSAFPVLITRANLPNEMCSPTDANRAQSDGGDIRAAASNDGTGQLAIDIVSFAYDSVDGAGDAVIEIWVKRDLNTISDTSVWLAYNTAGTTVADAVTDPFGRNAVWSDYLSVLHLVESGNGTSGEYADSTGNGLTGRGGGGTSTRAPSQSSTNHPWGGVWQSFDGTDDYIEIENSGSALDASFMSVSAWIRETGNEGDHGVISNRTNATATNYFQLTNANVRTLGLVHDGSAADFDEGTSVGTNSTGYLALTTESGALTLYLDGASQGGAAVAGDGQFSQTSPVVIGTYFDKAAVRSLGGQIGEVRLRLGTLSADWLATEYANQNSPATFIVEGTPEAVGGGGATTLTADAGSYTLTGQSAGLLNNRLMAAGIGTYSLSGQAAGTAWGHVIAADQGGYTLTGQAAGTLWAHSLAAAQGSYTLTGQDATLTASSGSGATLTADVGSYALTGQDATGVRSRIISAAQGGYTLTGLDVTFTLIRWEEQSSATAEQWTRIASDETDWDGGDTLWDVGVNGLVRTAWDVELNGISWSAQSSTAESWTVV